jgi:hypothetical protein
MTDSYLMLSYSSTVVQSFDAIFLVWITDSVFKLTTAFVHKVPRLSLQKKKHIFPELLNIYLTNFVALVRERTIPTEQRRLVCQVSANFCG